MTVIGWGENEEKTVTFTLYEQKCTTERHSSKAPEIFAIFKSLFQQKYKHELAFWDMRLK